MHVQQAAMLVFEAAVMSVIILSLFRARSVLGLTPLYVVLGGFQYLAATLSLRVQVASGFWLYPSSTILFTATLVTVLIVYVKEDAIEARKLVYGLVLANAGVSIMSLLMGWHVALPGSVSATLARRDFLNSSWIAMSGTSLLFLDVLGIILTYEFVSRFVTHLLLRLFLSLLAIVAFDHVLFTMLVQGERPDAVQLMISGFLGKTAAAAFYSVVCWCYFRFGEPHVVTVGTGDVADVFQALTYRQKYEQARQRMIRDGLTGLYNRGYFDEALPQALAHADRYGEPLSLVIIDADNFKNINDQLSHMEGDAVLRLIADTLHEHARAVDVPCRYGGDEFVVVLSRADADAADAFAERFREALQERCRTASPPFAWGHVTTTIGIATYPTDVASATPEELIRIADRRLYVGKNAGRDTVVTPRRELGPSACQPAGTS